MKKRVMAIVLCLVLTAVLFTPYASVLTESGTLPLGLAGAENDEVQDEVAASSTPEAEAGTAVPSATATAEPEDTDAPEVTATAEPAGTDAPEETATAEPAGTDAPEATATMQPAENTSRPATDWRDDFASMFPWMSSGIKSITMPSALDQIIEVREYYLEDGYSSVATYAVGTESVVVPENGKITLTGGSAQWQVEVEDGVWANIADETGSSLSVTGAFVRGLGGSATIRNGGAQTTVSLGGAVDVPSEVTGSYTIEGEAAEAIPDRLQQQLAMSSGAGRDFVMNGMSTLDDAPQTTYTIVINYVFANDATKEAASPFTATIAAGSGYKQTVKSPTVTGYTPNQAQVDIDVTNASADVTYTVIYNPAEVSYKVVHYQQKLDGDYETVEEDVTKKGYTDSKVGAGLQNSYDGFTALDYDTDIAIAADGSTVVEIYYDRNYYLLSIDLDGGYGAEPVYARYGASISVADPQRAGYTFAGWSLNGTDAAKLPSTMPNYNVRYKALWTPADTAKVTVVFWGENADDEKYSYQKSVETTGIPERPFTYTPASDDMEDSLWKFDRSETVTVAADGSSVVNVYYDRVEYDIKFYDARGNTEYSDARITAKWGASIREQWGANKYGTMWAVNSATGGSSTVSGPYQVYLEQMPVGGDKFYGPKAGNTTEHAYYYVEVLPGETGTETYDGKTYKLHHTDNAIRSSSSNPLVISNDDKYDIEGFEYKGFSATRTNSSDERYYYDGAKFFYLRNSYKLTFNDGYNDVRSEDVLYQASLSTYSSYEPEIPEGKFEEGSVEFGGWYLNPEGTGEKYDLTKHTMPANNVLLYAKWVPVTHTVKTYLDEAILDAGGDPLGTWEEVPHGTAVAESERPADPTNASYEFIAWFYKEKVGEEEIEHAFDFSMPVTKDLNLYAKWNDKTQVPYTIYYQLADGTPIAPDTTGRALNDTTKTFEAKTGNDLNAGYKTGYFPQTSSHSVIMTADSEKNVFTFVYVAKEKVHYTVRYLEKGTEKVLKEEKTVETANAVVTEQYEYIQGYMPDAYQKRLVLSANEEENVITFWYEEDNDHAPVLITHWTQNTDGTTYTKYSQRTELVYSIGAEPTESALTIPGFTYNETMSTATGKVTAQGLELNLYYDRIKYPYEFKFLEQGTDKELHASETGVDYYEKQVTQSALTINGYTLVSDQNQAIVIAIEDPANVAKNNVRIFYYTETAVTINYQVVGDAGCGTLSSAQDTNVKVFSGPVYGSTPTASSGYRFAGWYTDAACTTAVDTTWVNDSTKHITPDKTYNYGTETAPVMGYAAATYYAKFVRDTTDVTVKKVVTGLMGDKTYGFTFGCSTDNTTWTTNFTLKDYATNSNATHTISGVTIGSTLYFREEAVAGYSEPTIGYGSAAVAVEKTADGKYWTWSITVVDGQTMTVTNDNGTQPDTGVILDSLPYVLILALVALGAVSAVVRRRRSREDD